ncbi:MAG: hypothetical protein HN572_02825 [Kordiimonadaceae bacterium]|jgi:hypothetical protein|nr:hypothetical protein [Kordiimonadaceae bacterium]
MFMGFAGLAFDTSLWLMERRTYQHTVDSAAIAGAYALKANENITLLGITTDAEEDAALNGFTVGGNNTLDVQNPPTAGAFTTNPRAVRAVLTSTVDGFFSQFFGYDNLTVDTVATAGIFAVEGAVGCIIGLSGTLRNTVNITGSNTTSVGCAVVSNSTHASGLSVGGNGELEATDLIANEGIRIYGSADTSSVENIDPNQGVQADPYDHLEIPGTDEIPVCTEDKTNYTFPANPADLEVGDDPFYDGVGDAELGTYVLTPGRYCGGLNMGMNSATKGDVILMPGVYIMDAGDFDIGSQAEVFAEGVTIILTADNPADIGNVDINGGAGVTLSAQTTEQINAAWNPSELDPSPTALGEYAGVLIYQDRDAPYESNSNTINGGSTMTFNGAVYFPKQEITFVGTAGMDNDCARVIGNQVTLSGDSDFSINNDPALCGDYGFEAMTIDVVRLME